MRKFENKWYDYISSEKNKLIVNQFNLEVEKLYEQKSLLLEYLLKGHAFPLFS